MVWAIIVLGIVVLSLGIWFFLEFKRMKHKVFALFLIGLVLFIFFSAVFVFNGKEVDYKTGPGVMSATKVYFSWLGSVFGNFKTITTNAIKMDWKGNEGNSTKKK